MVAGRTHHPVWNEQACMPCGGCRQACPVWADELMAAEADSLRARVAREHAFPGPTRRRPQPPCTATCPLGQDVAGYTRAIHSGDMALARRIILETNPLPGVLSFLCLRACESACVRASLDGPVSIRRLKGVPFDDADLAPVPFDEPSGDEDVAILGAGPAGLASAWYLARRGLRPAIHERRARPGGMLDMCIPRFVLPRDILDADLGRIAALGVTLATGVDVRDLRDLSLGGRRPVIVAAGAPVGMVPPALSPFVGRGATSVVTFMRSPRLPVDGRVLVQGEGPAALAAARSALRRGATEVTLVVDRPLSHSALDAEALRLARAEGVMVRDRTGIVRARGRETLESVLLVPLAPHPAGRGRVVMHPAGDPVAEPVDLVVSALRREPDPRTLESLGLPPPGPAGTIAPDAAPGVLAAGDLVHGSHSVVDAVASGIAAARAVLAALEVTP